MSKKKKKATNKQILNISGLKILFCKQAGLQEVGQTTRESSSGFIFVMTKNWQRISKTPDKIID